MNQIFDFLFNHSPILYFVQSLWRDEAFSILVAEKPISFFLGKLSFEPPVYYILLHFWIKIFGNSEIATRSLSFIGFAAATIIVIEWADKIFKKSWLAFFLPVFFFLNPMLLYYAFEVRTYGIYIFFATLSMYAYLSKKWTLYSIAVILGFYTHTYFVFTILSQVIHYGLINFKNLSNKISIKKLLQDKMIKSCLISLLFILPWVIKIVFEMTKLKQSWYFPVDLNLIKSVLGNLFLGYEGTPWYLWKTTNQISILLIVFFILAYLNRKQKIYVLYFLINVFLPLIIVIGISFLKPLYVNRYLIPVTISIIFLIILGIEKISNKTLQVIVGILLMSGIMFFNLWYPAQHKKIPIRNTIKQIDKLRTNKDYIYANSSLIFFEILYYSQNKNGIYLYNPGNSPFPWYVGDAVFSEKYMIQEIPFYPQRAFLVNQDGSYKIIFQMSNNKIN